MAAPPYIASEAKQSIAPQGSTDCFVARAPRNDGESGGHSMIDHISVGVADLERSARFYEAILAPLGLSRVVTRPATIGFGKAYPEFWINLRAGMAPISPESGTHICLRAKTTANVDAFHAAALASGGRSGGAPGIRPHDRVELRRLRHRSRRQPHRGRDVSERVNG